MPPAFSSPPPLKSPVYGTLSPVYWTHPEGGKERYAVEVTMKWVRGHVEVYDGTGRFLFSADNEGEAQRELDLAA